MKLIKLTYKANNWELEDLELEQINLIVGKNATGKSRTLLTIDFLYKMITQKTGLDWGVKWDIVFENNKKDIIHFTFDSKHTHKEGITFEEITINNEQVLHRQSDKGKIKNFLTGSFDDIYPPNTKLVIHTNRDLKKYPYLEEIANWAENSYGFKFGNISPLAQLKQKEYNLLSTIDDIPKLFKELNKKSIEKVVRESNDIGFEVTDLLYHEDVEAIIIVKEKGVNYELQHYRLSQGMYRSLAVLIFFEYLISKQKPATVVIDDLCEGLDYDRATKLGKIIFEKCFNSNIQLIATSNDMFLMDVIEIKYWNVLQRKGKKVTTINIKNNPELFKNFKYTGLSNFDFFASDYIPQKTAS